MMKSERTRIEVTGLSPRSHRNNKVLATLIDHRVFWSCIQNKTDIDYSLVKISLV